MPISPAVVFTAGTVLGAGLGAVGHRVASRAHRRAVAAVLTFSVRSILDALARLARDAEMPRRLRSEVEHLQDLARAVLSLVERDLG